MEKSGENPSDQPSTGERKSVHDLVNFYRSLRTTHEPPDIQQGATPEGTQPNAVGTKKAQVKPALRGKTSSPAPTKQPTSKNVLPSKGPEPKMGPQGAVKPGLVKKVAAPKRIRVKKMMLVKVPKTGQPTPKTIGAGLPAAKRVPDTQIVKGKVASCPTADAEKPAESPNIKAAGEQRPSTPGANFPVRPVTPPEEFPSPASDTKETEPQGTAVSRPSTPPAWNQLPPQIKALANLGIPLPSVGEPKSPNGTPSPKAPASKSPFRPVNPENMKESVAPAKQVPEKPVSPVPAPTKPKVVRKLKAVWPPPRAVSPKNPDEESSTEESSSEDDATSKAVSGGDDIFGPKEPLPTTE